ncbi:zincin-like metallopeptidase domain-containing protein [Listeria innocua]|uniref:zincin-like metallopeptidase domain-containing protein n=1 Tax=Listeria innocua TaxID=1642 RepID=UPI00200A8CA7|nr:zincin-like metallopeptidase domain-containing protein [Listeria innocua]UPH67058.1 zincin-like metallopeptidase domain-containing protein [Listeria innocua]
MHELAHERLHNYERLQNENKNGGSITYSTEVKELQAEMTSYIVCHHIGMDTEDFSLPYIANWTKNGDEIEDKIAVLKEVKNASSDLIEEINNELDRSKNKDLSIENSYSVEKENNQQGYYTPNSAALSR